MLIGAFVARERVIVSIGKSSLMFSLGTILSRVSGLVRDQILLGVFGVSYLLDAFFLAFRVPNLFREMLAEGALGGAFTKVYSELRVENPAAARSLFVQCLQIALLISLVLVIAGLFLGPLLVDLMTIGSGNSEIFRIRSEAKGLSTILFCFLGIAIFGSIVSGALHERGRFFSSAVAPIGFNLGFVLGALFFSDWFSAVAPAWWDIVVADTRMTGLAFGVLIGGLLQVVLQSRAIVDYTLIKDVLKKRILILPGTKQVIRLMVPASLAAATGPLGVIINTNFAIMSGEGAVTWLTASFRLFQLPVGVFGVAVGAAVLPKLTKQLVKNSNQFTKLVAAEVSGALDFVCWLLAPCFMLLCISSSEIVTLLFQHGKFTAEDTLATSSALFLYSFGVLGYGLQKVLTSLYFALGRTLYAMWVTIFCLVLSFAINAFFVGKIGHLSLALAASLSLSANALLLLVGLSKYGAHSIYRNIFNSAFKLAIVSCCGYGFVRLCHLAINSLHYGVRGDTKLAALIQLLINSCSLGLIFLIGLWVFKKVSPRTLFMEIFARSR